VSLTFAPAKLTVTLEVTGVRSDGFHELRSEMVALSLADELDFAEGMSGLTVEADQGTRGEELVGSADNLITRALLAVGRDAAVRLVKRIPLGGGLGGGSSDAAAVLRWAGCADVSVAIGLGSDVPFSLTGGHALVEGIGERVTPLEFVDRRFLLVIPPFGVDTTRVYAAWDAGARSDDPVNALTGAALTVEPRLAGWRDELEALTGLQPHLAGSGSTWFVEEDSRGANGHTHTWLQRGNERARLLRARTVPAGWNGD